MLTIGINLSDIVLTYGIIKNLSVSFLLLFKLLLLIWNLILLWIVEKIKCREYLFCKKILIVSIKLFSWNFGWHK